MSRSRIREYLHTEYQPGERVLIRKIDFFILTFCCLSYFINYVRPARPPLLSSGAPQQLIRLRSSIAPTLPMPTFRA